VSKITSDDLKTLVEFVKKKDNEIVSELTEKFYNFQNDTKSIITEEVVSSLRESIKSDPSFRGPTGFSGKDGNKGDRGDVGPMGPVPTIEFSEDRSKVRFQKGNLLSESTGEYVTDWTDWVDIKGDSGPIGEQGPQGPRGEDGRSFVKASIFEDHLLLMDDRGDTIDLGSVKGPQGEKGPQGPQGNSLTWHDLTESQRQMLVGPQGESGPKGDPGTFPKVQPDAENHRVRFQVSEDVENPWSEWMYIPEGPMGLIRIFKRQEMILIES